MNSETSIPQDVQIQAKPENAEQTPDSSAHESTPDMSPPPSPQEAAAAEQTSPASLPAAVSAPASSTAMEPVEAADEQKPRVRLNPTVDASQARPVPNVAPASVATPVAAVVVEQAPAPAPAAEPRPEPVAQVSPPAAKTEIPRDAQLDDSLLAEIASMQSAEAMNAPAQVATVASESSSEEGAPPAVPTEETLEVGHRVKGKVLSVHADDVFFDLGLRSQGVVSLRQFAADKPPAVGNTYDLVVDKISTDEGLIHCNLPRGRRKIAGNWDAVSVGQVVECMVTKTNKGGLEVTVSSLRGFMPAGQVDIRFVSDLEPFVGQKLDAVILEANPKKRNLVVSRKAFLDIARKDAEENIWKTLNVGQTFTGTVKTIKDYGAFVDIGGVDGFLHVGEISWNRLKHPSEILSEGAQVEVKVLTLDTEKKRIGLGMKQLIQNPWQKAVETYAPGTTVSGKVTRTTEFGAFIELEQGVEGLVHISELEYRRVARVTEVVKEGEQHDFKVLEVDPERRRISLSLKALKEQPQAPARPKDEDLAPSSSEPAYERKRRGDLKGGTGGAEGGRGLFGNPGDFGR